MTMSSKTIKDVGEFGLIAKIHELLLREGIQSDAVTTGIGDDAAAFCPHPGMEILLTCDALVEGRHYLPDYIGPFDLGRRAMAINISDIGAMGGYPLYALVSLGLKGDTLVEDVMDLYKGFVTELNPMGASVVGGNITKSTQVFIDITLVGEVERGKAIRRSGAKAGDAILITGFPGRSVGGLKLLLHAGKPAQDLRKHPLVKAYNTPTHRAREGRAVLQSGYATAMIDTSDGFLGDLGHICQESHVGAELVQRQLPLSRDLQETASELDADPYDWLLGESDDYELIITCPPKHAGDIRAAIGAISDVPVTEVGRVTSPEQGLTLITADGTRRAVTPAGWNHFEHY